MAHDGEVQGDDARLVAVARELHALRPAEFVAARTARAKEVAAGGDRPLAARIRALARPPAAAWAVNALDSERPELVERAVGIGERLRSATAERDAAAVRKLGRERHAVLGEIARAAAEVAEAFDVGLSAAAVGEVQQTFQAAMADEDAAAAVQSGVLVRSLASDGLGPVDLEGALAVPGLVTVSPRPAEEGAASAAGEAPTRSGRPTAAARGSRRTPDSAERTTAEPKAASATERAAERAAARERARREAQEERRREAEDARREADEAEARLTAIDLDTRDNEELRARLTDEIQELKEQLAAAQDDLAETARAATRLRTERAAAERTAAAARREADRLERRLN